MDRLNAATRVNEFDDIQTGFDAGFGGIRFVVFPTTEVPTEEPLWGSATQSAASVEESDGLRDRFLSEEAYREARREALLRNYLRTPGESL